jgi:membrane protease YdiL (CAAX protease family)
MMNTQADKTILVEKQKSLPVIPSLLFIVGYFGLSFVRGAGWIPKSWSVIPVVETAWVNFFLVLGVIIWMRVQKIPLAHVGLGTFQPSRSLLMLVIGTMAVDYFVIGIATPALASFFGEPQQVARFQELPGNLPLLLLVLPLSWVIGAFGEEFFFRGFMLTAVAEILGASRAAWFAAVFIQAVGFGLIHFEQGSAQAISIGISGMVFGAAYLFARKNLWPVILAHGINNTLGFILLYPGAIVR